MVTAQCSTICDRGDEKPATIQDVRNLCEQREQVIKDQVKATLVKWLEDRLANNRPWRSWVEKNKRGKFFPIHRYIYKYEPKADYRFNQLYWPNIPKDVLCEFLEELGYIVSKYDISISVPMQGKGQVETFAQQWANKLNVNCSNYCIIERNRAKEYYNGIMEAICSSKSDDFRLVEGGEYYSITLIGGMLDDRGVYCREIKKLFAKEGIKHNLITAPNTVKTEYFIPRKNEKE